MVSLFLSFSLICTAMTIYSNHPGTMAGLLLLSAISVAVITLFSSISWFFYVISLVFLGGVMLIVIYMASLASNEKFIYSSNSTSVFFGLISFLVCCFSCLNFSYSQILSSSFKFSGTLYFYMSGGYIVVIMLLLLLAAMLTVVGLVKLEKGPLVKSL